MTAELDRLEAEVIAARMRLSGAVGRLTADAAPTAVGSSAAKLSMEWARERVGGGAADLIQKHPVVSVLCLAGLVLVLGRLGEGATRVAPSDVDGYPRDQILRLRV